MLPSMINCTILYITLNVHIYWKKLHAVINVSFIQYYCYKKTHISEDNLTNPSSHVNYRFLDSTSKDIHIKKLQKDVRINGRYITQ